METKQVKELLLQSLEHEMGGIKVYETALKCAVNEDLKEEWEKYHQETEHHVQVLHDVFSQMQLDPDERTPGRGMHIEPVDARSRKSAPVVLVYPYGIVVDCNGRRFCDEGAGLMHETWEALARTIHFSLPGRIAWSIHDSSLLEIDGYERAIRSEVAPFRAEYIDELAAMAGIDPKGLAGTVAAYNAAAPRNAGQFDASRIDGVALDRSLSPPKSNWARPIVKPPFLAWPLVGAIAYTFGGIATNDEAEALGPSGPIPRLYAAGEITGHFHHTAPNAVAVMRALVFGRIAGRNAVNGLK